MPAKMRHCFVCGDELVGPRLVIEPRRAVATPKHKRPK